MDEINDAWFFDKKLQCYMCADCGTEVVFEDGGGVCACNSDDLEWWNEAKG